MTSGWLFLVIGILGASIDFWMASKAARRPMPSAEPGMQRTNPATAALVLWRIPALSVMPCWSHSFRPSCSASA